MIWASALSTRQNTDVALTEIEHSIWSQLDGKRPDFVCAFVSSHHADNYRHIAQQCNELFKPRVSLGCSGAGLVGGGEERESGPGIALCAAHLPDVATFPFHIRQEQCPSADAGPDAWAQLIGADRSLPAHFVLMANLAGPPPFDPRPLLAGLDFAYPGCTQIGGLASALDDNVLFLDGSLHANGLIGIALQGNIEMETLVARGCRPLGDSMTANTCEHNLLFELDDRPASQVLAELYHSLSEADQARMRDSLLLGIASTEIKDPSEPHEFLMRNIVQMDHEKGFLAIGDVLRPGQTVQFHLRDTEAANEELDLLLRDCSLRGDRPHGALLFTCTGRGQHLFSAPNYESSAFFDRVGRIPLTGFFCSGEIGPVGHSTHLHGYTSSFGLFRPARK